MVLTGTLNRGSHHGVYSCVWVISGLQNKDAVGTALQSGTYWVDNGLAWHYRVLTGYSRVPLAILGLYGTTGY
jgi:hypothetical protein